jgi:hypothetical protein
MFQLSYSRIYSLNGIRQQNSKDDRSFDYRTFHWCCLSEHTLHASVMIDNYTLRNSQSRGTMLFATTPAADHQVENLHHNWRSASRQLFSKCFIPWASGHLPYSKAAPELFFRWLYRPITLTLVVCIEEFYLSKICLQHFWPFRHCYAFLFMILQWMISPLLCYQFEAYSSVDAPLNIKMLLPREPHWFTRYFSISVSIILQFWIE